MRPSKILGLLLIISTLLFLYFKVPQWITINNIECKSQYGPCRKNIETLVKSYEGKSLNEAKDRINESLSKENSIEDLIVTYELTDKLQVFITQKKAKFALKDKETGKFILLDKNGYVISSAENTFLPTLTVAGIGDNKNIAPREYLFGLNLVYELYDLQEIEKAELKEDKIEILFYDGNTAIFPKSGKPDVLLNSLKLILRQLNRDEQETKINEGITCENSCTIDLRFKNPIVR